MQGYIKSKMKVDLQDKVNYSLLLNDESYNMNELIGKKICLTFTGNTLCGTCKDKKVWKQGHCYPCFMSQACTDICIVSPEKCHYGEESNPCRDESFAQEVCFKTHTIYLSYSSNVKVGITRGGNEKTRWIDQGATMALPIARVKDRLSSGLVEVELKKYFKDRTSWQKMLKGSSYEKEELLEAKKQALEALKNLDVELVDEDITIINYPVLEYPLKVKSYNLEKTPQVEGKLMGIKGQYLVFESGALNIRKYEGFEISINIL
ncbi:MAG: hypothetical protein COB02_14440 [Candidatus Cloacimonadota bacterium]|nr:MAG: hypothetical protein COB02_14440 [Candidatus Cloacimonadota bacterium]